MNEFQCAKNISSCLNFYNLTLCSLENNTCVENHGYCVFNEKIKPKCVCLLCFTGEHCEEEKVSRNLWSLFVPYNEVAERGASILAIITVVFGAFLLLNGILCLQTYLCKKIRDTNVGIYLIMLTIVSIFIGLILVIFPSIFLHAKELRQSDVFSNLNCIIYGKFVYIPLVAMYNWFIASVAIERALVVCSRNYGLQDSRRRSVIASAIIVIICPLTTLPGVFTVRESQPAELRPVQCINFTPLGYILYRTITQIHFFAFYFIYIVMNIVVLGNLVRHRRRFVDSGTLPAQVCVVLQKHKDLFIPYLIQALGQLPNTIMDLIMTCSTANTTLVARLSLVFTVLQVVPFIITFYLYIYLSSVYWSEFWSSSPIGKYLMKVKKKMQTIFNRNTIQNNNLSQTRF